MNSTKPTLAIAALGVVFGDIGTSPLYGFRVALSAANDTSSTTVLGILSLIAWALFLVVTVKYVMLILRVDNGGEGGILALAALLSLHKRHEGIHRNILLIVAISGGALLFGDAVITPAISVLSAVEGLHDFSPKFEGFTVPIACTILFVLFYAQRFGVMKIGSLFGPIMLVWFATIGLSGLLAIVSHPSVLLALSPHYGFELAVAHPGLFLGILSGVFLTVTGGEALYADLGQFGRAAITRAWLLIALPALVLNYFGQGAMLLANSAENIENTFYALFPSYFILPIVGLATLATIIASQAVITGLFSLGRQAIQLGFLPPIRVLHMDHRNEHDVYLPLIGGLVGFASIMVVIAFGTSDNLADAYGIAVAGAMVTTTVLYVEYLISRRSNLSAKRAIIALLSPILFVDLVFVVASAEKLLSGGMLPLVLALVVMLIVVAWQKGRQRMTHILAEKANRMPDLARSFSPDESSSTVGVFLVRPGQRTPAALHEVIELVGGRFRQIVVLSVWTTSKPRVPVKTSVSVLRINTAVTRIDVNVGYMQRIDLPSLIGETLVDLKIDPKAITYIANLERPIAPTRIRRLDDIYYTIFTVLARLAVRSTDRFKLPAKRTLEVGIPRKL